MQYIQSSIDIGVFNDISLIIVAMCHRYIHGKGYSSYPLLNIYFTLKVEGILPSEISVAYQTTQRQISYNILHKHLYSASAYTHEVLILLLLLKARISAGGNTGLPLAKLHERQLRSCES
jgi:hypothetical protein